MIDFPLIDFIWWGLLCLWPLFFVFKRIFKPLPVVAPPIDLWVDAKPSTTHRSRSNWLALMMWSLLLIAVARPVTLGEAARAQSSGRDLQMAIDISGSMLQDDFIWNNQPISRIDAVKAVAHQFIEARKGDRIGLILYADQAYVHTPLSYDIKTQQFLLLEAEVGLAGKKTAIGDAIALAVKRLREKPAQSRVLILLSDGVNNSGVIEPEQAIELARAAGVKIHSIAVGIKQRNNFFASTSDSALLQLAAKTTGGRFFDAQNTQDLMKIYQAIDALEPSIDARQQRRHQEWYWLPVLIFLALLILRRPQ